MALSLAVAAHAGIVLMGQAHVIFNGTESACTGALLDSGGEGASGYGNNENITYTICPDQPGGAISLNFITFTLSTAGAAPVDYMTIYDGDGTTAPVLGTWTGTGLQGQVVSASAGNPTGCLTIVFRSNNTGTGVFAAAITCYQPCERPTAVADHGTVQPLKICPGESVTFNGTASYAAPGFSIANRRWDFGDGTVQDNAPAVVNHAYAQPGAYTAQLYLEDDNGCASTNLVDLLTLVGTHPTFIGVTGTSGCSAEELCLTGSVTPTTWNELPDANLGGGVFLPDNVGECFSTTLTFTHFAPGQTLTNVNQLLGICVNMEHSFMGDLIIRIIGPTGQTVILHQQGGGGTYLGIPVDNEATPNVQGTCWEYCWSPAASNGTWAANGTGGTLPSGTYQSLQSLAGLLGSPLNGTWTFEVCDMWGIDNGFICDWGLEFDPALYPGLIQFTPVYGAGCDSSYWSGPNISSTSANCDQVCTTGLSPGNHAFIYTVVDDFGCTYDTTVTVTINPDLMVDAGPDASTCGTPVQLGATVNGATPVASCDYQLWLYDSWGDGWDVGAYVTVTVNGVPQSWTLNGGTSGFTTVTVPTGATITLTYYDGGWFWSGEQSFELLDSEGNTLYFGNDPANGLVWSGVANCPGGELVYSWSPASGLSNPSLANPVANVSSTTQYCVTVYEADHPDCAVTDCMTITVDDPPNPGSDASHTVCGTASMFTLFNLLSGSPPAGGTWTGPNQTASDGTFTPGTNIPGVYSYSVTTNGPCGGATAVYTIIVNVNAPPDPGSDGSITLCGTGAAVDLFAQLGGTPDAGGAWAGPSVVAGGTFDPATMNAGVYTYTVNGVAPCPDESATVTVTVNAPPDPGSDGDITLCGTGAAVDLFAQLGGTPDAGGTWAGPSAVAGGTFDPATMNAGVYTYTVVGVAPCPDESATVTVTVNASPDPGSDGGITLCGTGAAVDLFAQLGGTPDAGGTWAGPSAVAGGTFDPATMNAGDYTYTVNGVAPCPDESATVTVTVNAPPDPGSDGSITLCGTGAAVDLFAQLGGTPDAGGAWAGPSAVAGGTFDPATMNAGVYTYTVNGVAPCPDESATVTVTVNASPDPGSDGGITLCGTGAAVDLFAQLGGTPDAGGTWAGPSAVAGGTFDPATMNAGVYTYTVVGVAPCPDESASVTVTVNTPPDPGSDGSITLCGTGAAVDLFAQLGGTPDAGGAWAGPSAVAGGTFDPATMNAGVYTYTVNGVAPCPDETAVVDVVVHAMPNAGIDGGLTLCSSSPATTLISGLNGNPDTGGTWTAPGGAQSDGFFTPGASPVGPYTYTVQGVAPCPTVTATVDVAVVTNPDAGMPGSATLCATDGPILLFAQLGGTPDAGGTWTGPSAVNGGLYDPATMDPGVYTYTISVPPPCTNAASTVTIARVAPPDAGSDGAITLCISSPAASLFDALGGSPDAGGSWAGPSAVAGGLFDPATMNAGDYTYTVQGNAPCPADAAVVSVSVVSAPDAGTPGSATLCATDGPILLFAQLGGTPDAGGAWTGPSAVSGGVYDPATMDPGVYTYTISVPPPCTNAASTVTIARVAPPDAGSDGAITLCISSPAASLFDALGGSPDAGGSWAGPSAVAGGLFDPATMNAGDYTYTVQGNAPCPADAAVVSVSVVSAPDAGTPGSATLCATDGPILLFAQLGGTPDAGGAWTGPSAVSGGVYDPATMDPGVYTYTISVPPPCANAASTVTIARVAPPDAGSDGAITLCISSPAASLFDALGGSPDAGGSWAGPSAVAGGLFDPATMSAGDYTYTVQGNAPCPADAAVVSVSVVSAPDAGTPGSATLCATDGPILLFAQLGGTPDAGGAWTGPSAVSGGLYDPATMDPGVYTYTISVPPPCTNAASTVTIARVAPPDAGGDGAITLCISSPAASLFDALGGSPDAGGSWAGPSAVAGGLFDPATMNAGDYTYTVQGNAPCPADAAVVSVSVMSAPDAGTPGAIALCTSDKPVSLFDALGGTPDIGGSWNGPSSVAGGQFDPATMAAGTYTYTISVPPPCADASSAVEVTLETPPDAGHDGTLTLCITGAPAALFGALGGTPDAGGSWSGPGTVVDGLFDPGSMPPGDYTYTVEGTSPCPGDMAVVSVGVVEVPHAGTNGVLNLCSSGDPLDLFPALGDGADPNGSWTPPNGGTFDGTFIPGMSVPGEYTYTVAGGPPCPSASAFLSVNVVDNADAGGDGDLSLCSSNDAVNLFTRLQGAPNTGGSWFLPNGGMFNGLFDPQGHPSGTYTYVVAVPLPCVNDTAQVVVQVEQAVSAGTDTSIVLCNTDGVISLNAQLGGTPDEVGSWTGPEGPSSMAFHPGIDPPGDYTYLVVGTPPCPNASATVSIAVNPMPDAGLDGSLSICPEAAAVSLFSVLNGGPQTGGTWTGPNGLPHAGLFDPSVDAPGPYTYTVPGSAPCPNDQASATMVIHVVPAPHAGNDMVSCSYAGNLAATGTWATGSWGSITPGAVITDPGSASTPVTVNTGGSYTFVWNTISAEGCVSADSVSIVFTGPIIPEVATTPATCHGSCDGEATVTATGGNVGAGGYHYTWPAGTSANGAHSTGYCAGDHLVTVLDTNNCAAMAGFTILQPEPLAIAEVAPSNTLCPESCDGTILVNDPQGVLFSINGGPFQEANLFSGLCPGTYSITMLDAHGCGAGTTAVVASPPPVVAGFSVHPDTVAMNDPVVELTNTSSANATHYLWQFGDGQESGEVNPVHAFPMGIETVYTICLTATTDNGCPDTYCARLPVVGLPGIFVPNAFTPDQDGRNDIFRVAGSRIASDHFELLIFNRWGECIYTATDPGSGWDGTFHGREVTPDVYVWKLVFRFQGEIENRELRGHVTVVR